MEYYLVQVQQFNDGKAEARGLFAYAKYEDALAAYHSVMFSSISDPTIKSVLCEIINETGRQERYEYWVRPVEPEPEPVEE